VGFVIYFLPGARPDGFAPHPKAANAVLDWMLIYSGTWELEEGLFRNRASIV